MRHAARATACQRASLDNAYVAERDAVEAPTACCYAVASLVRVASGYRLQPSRKTASSVASVFRKEMDFGHHQRLGATMSLSEDEGSRRAGRANIDLSRPIVGVPHFGWAVPRPTRAAGSDVRSLSSFGVRLGSASLSATSRR